MKQKAPIIVIMGVSGCGKSTVGKALASKLKIPFFDADDFHPTSNRLKMESGIPLTDEDRLPWLQTLSNLISEHAESTGVVLACSALKKSYREELIGSNNRIEFVYLKGEYQLIADRMLKRNHFMPKSLLESQFETLEEPDDAITIDIELDVISILEQLAIHFPPQ